MYRGGQDTESPATPALFARPGASAGGRWGGHCGIADFPNTVHYSAVTARPLSEPSGVEGQLPSAGGVNDETCHVQRTALSYDDDRGVRREIRRRGGAVWGSRL